MITVNDVKNFKSTKESREKLLRKLSVKEAAMFKLFVKSIGL